MTKADWFCGRLRTARNVFWVVVGMVMLVEPAVVGLRMGAQAAASVPRAAFEVATIKPSDPLNIHEHMSMGAGGMFNATVSVKSLIERAYGIREDQVEGGPKWMESARYDIVARSDDKEDPSTMSPAQQDAYIERQQERLRSLLMERFQLKFHEVVKDRPVYALVVVRQGPKLSAPKEGEAHRLYSQGPGQLACFGASMAELASELPDVGVSRIVLDKTGLTGRYDFALRWTPDELPANTQPADANQGSLFTALQEQLGLKLVSQKGPVKVMVIDWLERPSEN
jgi:uncharacterized protein (TIGR03435 family)